MPFFNIIAETNEATVVTEYKPIASNSALYQSEAELEKEFIKLLQNQGYDYINIHKEEDLIVNLRKQLELLNNIAFSDDEWDKLFKQKICNQNYGIVEKTRIKLSIFFILSLLYHAFQMGFPIAILELNVVSKTSAR